MPVKTCRHTRRQKHILPENALLALLYQQISALCALAECPGLFFGVLCGGSSEGSREVKKSGNSLLIPTELAFRFAAGLLPNRHHRSRPVNQRGTQALMRADAWSRCGRVLPGHREGAKQGIQWQ